MGLLHGWSVAAVWALALAGALSSASDAPAARSITGRVLVGHPSAVRVKLNGGQFEAIPNAAGAFTLSAGVVVIPLGSGSLICCIRQ